jgi:hypothetical protein
MQFGYGFKTRANRIAVKVRSDLGLSAEEPLDPWQVCEHFEIDVIRLSSLRSPTGELVGDHFLRVERGVFSAITVVCGMRRAIVHNDWHALVRQRSNLMHEIAHALLGHRATPLLTGNGERHFDQMIEAEAHFLGGSLLITNEAAYRIARYGLEGTAPDLYGVSERMLRYRLQVSGAMKRVARSAGVSS